MSDLALKNILTQDGLKSIPTDTIIEGTPKAWAHFDGQVSPGIKQSFNFSSFVDIATGRFQMSTINAMADNDYGSVGGSEVYGGGAALGSTATTLLMNQYNSSAGYADRTRIGIALLGAMA